MKKQIVNTFLLALAFTTFFYLIFMIGTAEFKIFHWPAFIRWIFSFLIALSGFFSWGFFTPNKQS